VKKAIGVILRDGESIKKDGIRKVQIKINYVNITSNNEVFKF